MSRIHPKVENAPGLIWRPYQKGWEARWQARTDLVNKGFAPKSQRLWTGEQPTETEAAYISDSCQRLQTEMLLFSRGGIPVAINVFDGTIRSLVNCYQTDPHSRYHKKRYSTRRNHDTMLRRIAVRHGPEELRDIKGRTLLAWCAEWSDGGRMLATWQSVRGLLRVMFSFGFAILEDPECERLCALMSSDAMEIEHSPPRTQSITAEWATAIRVTAREHFDWPCMALAQALQFELTLRQKDVIGEWVPISEPGTSDITWRKQKWLRGLRWSEVDANFVLKHVTSKRQKEIEVNLMLAPMVLEELALMAGVSPAMLRRDMFPTTGPIVKNRLTNWPYNDSEFRRKWRKVANVAGIPRNVFNMDSRAGAISEAVRAGAPLTLIRHAATHSDIAMTQKYDRQAAEATATVMTMRIEKRNKPKTE
ncbi:MAG TPA: tyrosine-type recombinase/integrase [Verrucomicrobiae bacterium]|nr:tyrosine-type recombinase/integrase [Verrucomicrobiae bacterium]